MRDQIEELTLRLTRILSSEDGQTMVEYALLVVFIAMVVLVAVQLLGTNLVGFFTSAANSL